PADGVGYIAATSVVMIDVLKATPVITWIPAPVMAGASLAGAQLNATANVPGTFSYSPPPGTPLTAGMTQTLTVTFTPADRANYNIVTASVSIDVAPPPLTVTVVAPNGGEVLFASAQNLVEWSAAGGTTGGGMDGTGTFDVAVSFDNGASYA